MPRPDLCLEFVNTRFWRGQATPTETLRSPEDLAAWAVANVSKEARPPAGRDFDQALELRETIYRLFDAVAQDKPPASRDLQSLNAALTDAPMRTRLKRDRDGFSWEVEMKASTGLGMLAPVLWSAGDLLAGAQLARVRRCANPDCGWLFLDDSRAGKRRWCSMQSCGNRAKARRHYHKSKEET